MLASGYLENRVSIWNSKLYSHAVVSHTLKANVLNINYYTRLPGYSWGRKTSSITRKTKQWPVLATSLCLTVCSSPVSAENRIKMLKNVIEVQLFPGKDLWNSFNEALWGTLRDRQTLSTCLFVSIRFCQSNDAMERNAPNSPGSPCDLMISFELSRLLATIYSAKKYS